MKTYKEFISEKYSRSEIARNAAKGRLKAYQNTGEEPKWNTNEQRMVNQIKRMYKGETKNYELASKTQEFYYKNKELLDLLYKKN